MKDRWDVLVVDDEPVVCDGVRLILEAAGHCVATVTSASLALSHPALETCDVVLCDIMLPGTSGIDLLDALRARRPGLPVVMITGYATPDVAMRAAQAGASGFLAKPFDETELIHQVRLAIARAAAVKESDP